MIATQVYVLNAGVGSAGPTGAAGANGATWRTGAGTPSNGTGVDGDLYLNTTTDDVYKRTSGTYSIVANILGAAGANGSNGSNGTSFDSTAYIFPRDFSFVLGAGTPTTIGNDKANWVTLTRDATIVKAFAQAKTAPVGAALIVDLLFSTNNGSTFTSIWTTTANRLTLADGINHGTQTLFDTTILAAGTILRIDVIQVGSGTAGRDVTVQLLTHLKS